MSGTMTHPNLNDPNAFVLYRYIPSLPAAIIAAILFALSTGTHIFQAYKFRTYYFIPLIIGGLCEVGGYIGRAIAHSNNWNLNLFIVQTVLLLIAPVLFSASIYMILGRIIRSTGGNHLSIIRPILLTKIFVCGDILAFFVQSGGGSLMAKASTVTAGRRLVVIGLLLQILAFGFFMLVGILFHVRIHRNPTPQSTENPWQRYMYSLYFASVLILFRSAIRVVEFQGGTGGSLLSHEFYLYIFDAVFMLGVLVSFNLIHPGHIINRKVLNDDIPLSRKSDEGERRHPRVSEI